MASRAFFTSWTRKMSAPLIRAMVLRTVVPFSAVSGVVFHTLLINDFLEMPMRMGRPL